jgi:hypothetical protein
MPHKFKKGDRLVVLKDYDPLVKGDIHTVTHLCECGCEDGITVTGPHGDIIWDSDLFALVRKSNEQRIKEREAKYGT